MTTATKGREQSCAQCGEVYRAQRSTSRYCRSACRQRAHHGAPVRMPGRLDMLRRWLFRRGFAGKVGPWNVNNRRSAIYGLTVPRSVALAEYNHAIAAIRSGSTLRTLEPMTEEEFAKAVKALSLFDHKEVPSALSKKR